MTSSDLNQSFDSLAEKADQLIYKVLEKANREDFEPIDELKVFLTQLTQLTLQVALNSLSENHNSLKELKLFAENLIILTRLLQQSSKGSQDSLSRVNKVQVWFQDDILKLLLKKEEFQVLLANKEMLQGLLYPGQETVPNPPPPPRSRPRP